MSRFKIRFAKTLRTRLTLGFIAFLLPVFLFGAYFFRLYIIDTTEADARRNLRSLLSSIQQENTGESYATIPKLLTQSEFAGKGLVVLAIDPRQEQVVWQSGEFDADWKKWIKRRFPNKIEMRDGKVIFTPQRPQNSGGPGGGPGGPPVDDGVRQDPVWRFQIAPNPPVILLAARRWSSIDGESNSKVLLFLALGTLGLAIIGTGSWIIIAKTLRPVENLSRQAEEASKLSNRVLLEAPSDDAEVVHLVETVNRMIDSVARSTLSKGRFYAAASHELRTPLGALQGHLELALSRERTVEQYKAALWEAKDQANRLISLTSSLLTLHQLETVDQIPTVEVDVADTVLRAVSRLNDPTVQAEVKGELTIRAQENHLDMLLRNLIENALRYRLPDTPIRVILNKNTLVVTNQAEELPAPFFEHIGEAFGRESYSRVRNQGGNGLGLSICKGIAERNNWEFRVGQEQGNFVVSVQFIV